MSSTEVTTRTVSTCTVWLSLADIRQLLEKGELNRSFADSEVKLFIDFIDRIAAQELTAPSETHES